MISIWSTQYKLLCQKVVGGISIMLGLAGITIIILGLIERGALPEDMVSALKAIGISSDAGEALALPIILLGVVVLLVAMLGCATSKYTKPCYAIPFGLINLIVGIIILVFATIALGGKSVQEPLLKLACTDSKTNPAIMFDNAYKTNVDKVMCSLVCPCKPDLKWHLGLNDHELRKYGRTIFPTPIELANFVKLKNEADIVPMSFIGTGKYYETFLDCYAFLKENYLNDLDLDTKEFQKWAETNIIPIIKDLESTLKCAGVCKPPLFYVTQSYTEQPGQTCITGLQQKLQPQIRLAGIVFILTGLIALVGFVGSFPLCSKERQSDANAYK